MNDFVELTCSALKCDAKRAKIGSNGHTEMMHRDRRWKSGRMNLGRMSKEHEK